MNSVQSNLCGCKGIRSCLLCESSNKTKRETDAQKETLRYIYCPFCNLCWPASSVVNDSTSPLYLDKLKIILEFLTAEEESSVISAIDKIPWMLSQSGRKKQDFGPKVNFKKKKVRIGDFKGFPNFTKKFLSRFSKYNELDSFLPVELCHLDYLPERGSAIEPHIDDSWIWGERLVTINLASTTVLTLTPSDNKECSCTTPQHKSIRIPEKNGKHCILNHLQFVDSGSGEVLKVPPHSVENMKPYPVSNMCSVHRASSTNAKVELLLILPPRSLVVLAGCARYNWFHGIKRDSIISRRLAMTFRELADDFLPGGDEEDVGNELLVLGSTFYES